jgi:hypothetical protein
MTKVDNALLISLGFTKTSWRFLAPNF